MTNSSVTVINAGIPGDGTAGMLARFDRDVARHRPDCVVLLAGINDMLYVGHTLTLAEMERNLRRLIAGIHALGSRCVLGNLPPIYVPFFKEQFPSAEWAFTDPQEKVACANAVIESLAQEYDLPLWNVRACIQSRPVDESCESFLQNPANSGRRDGLHWTPEATQRVARELAEILRSFPLPVRRIVCLGDSLTYGVYLRGKGGAMPGTEAFPGRLAAELEKE